MLKAIARRLIKKEHWSYLSWCRERFGLFSSIYRFVLLRVLGVGTARNPLTGGTIYLRPGTADQHVYDEIFIAGEYRIDLGSPKVIIDAGAHIGLASVYFASRYPHATVIAIEPEPANYAVLTKNVAQFRNIKPIQSGLWSRKAKLKIVDNSVDTWSFVVTESTDGNGIPAVCLPDIMKDHNIERIDVLKVDIEGSEIEVLNHSESWIGSVAVLIIELHDRYHHGCTAAFEKALKGYVFDTQQSGESIVLTNIRAA